MTARPTDRDASRNVQGGRPSPGPNARQEEILIAYAENPNAAAVSRALGSNERHVRRIVKQFPATLDELRRELHRERRARADARQAKMQQWADDSLDRSLRRLDALAESETENVAMRAVKLKLDLALHVPPVAPSSLDRELEDAERGLSRLLDATDDIERRDDQEERDGA